LPSEKSFDLNFDGSDVVVRISASAGNDSHSKSETVQWARCEPGKICKTKKQPSRRRRSECGARFCPMLGIMNDKQNGSTFLCSLTSVWEAELLSVGSLCKRNNWPECENAAKENGISQTASRLAKD
ncbi:hypothetical protein T4A_8549, partial [Trichinella pseudospiralis]